MNYVKALALCIALVLSAAAWARGGGHGGGRGHSGKAHSAGSNSSSKSGGNHKTVSTTGGAKGGSHYVAPHVTRSGQYVAGHMRTNPNRTGADNWSTKGNTNPYTSKSGTKPLAGSQTGARDHGSAGRSELNRTWTIQVPVVTVDSPTTSSRATASTMAVANTTTYRSPLSRRSGVVTEPRGESNGSEAERVSEAHAQDLDPPKPGQVGQDSFQVEQMARRAGCDPNAQSQLVGKSGQLEAYNLTCGNGETLRVRCEWGNCTVSK